MPKETTTKKVKDAFLGFDISTSVVGITALDAQTGKCIFIEPIIFSDNEDLTDIIDKAEFFELKLDELLKKYSINVVEIGFEDFAKKFTGGKSSISTILVLARFNGLVDFLIWKKFGIKSKKMNVRSIRKKLGIVIDKTVGEPKDQVLEQVRKFVDEEAYMPWVYYYPKRGKNKGKPVLEKCNYDMADSWVVAKATWLAYRVHD